MEPRQRLKHRSQRREATMLTTGPLRKKRCKCVIWFCLWYFKIPWYTVLPQYHRSLVICVKLFINVYLFHYTASICVCCKNFAPYWSGGISLCMPVPTMMACGKMKYELSLAHQRKRCWVVMSLYAICSAGCKNATSQCQNSLRTIFITDVL